MCHPPPKAAEYWSKSEWAILEKVVLALRQQGGHKATVEIRREANGSVTVWTATRHEQGRIPAPGMDDPR